MKFQRRHWLEDFAWRVERVTQKFRLSSVSFLSVYLFPVPAGKFESLPDHGGKLFNLPGVVAHAD
jgi:hypothetical protein